MYRLSHCPSQFQTSEVLAAAADRRVSALEAKLAQRRSKVGPGSSGAHVDEAQAVADLQTQLLAAQASDSLDCLDGHRIHAKLPSAASRLSCVADVYVW